MEYGKPQKLPDGRYFLRISGKTQQVNGLVLQDSLETKTVNFKVPEGSDIFKHIDEELLTQAKASKVEWFGKELSDETILNAFQESVTDGILGARQMGPNDFFRNHRPASSNTTSHLLSVFTAWSSIEFFWVSKAVVVT